MTRMLEEIHEQPAVLRELCRRAVDDWRVPRSLARRISSAVVVGSGSSFNAALMASFYLETVTQWPARPTPASEAFRHQVPGRPLAIGLSHSGSSKDVRAALKRAGRQGARTLALTNVSSSPITREADVSLVTGAGEEHAVPSTKGFTALAGASLLVASRLAGSVGPAVRTMSSAAKSIERWARIAPPDSLVAEIAKSKLVVFLGEGLLYPVARDGALKLLEVAYIPALAYPPEEFRHGPIAAVEPGVVVVTLDAVMRSWVDAIAAAGATVATLPSLDRVRRAALPFVRAAQLQLLAHEVGVRLGRDVDHPRGLTKVVG